MTVDTLHKSSYDIRFANVYKYIKNLEIATPG